MLIRSIQTYAVLLLPLLFTVQSVTALTIDPNSPKSVIYSEDFESTAEFSLPSGWTQVNETTPLDGSFVNGDTTDLADSQELEGWTVLNSEQLSILGDNRLSVPEVVSGKSVYAESDHRSGMQIQYLYTPVFDFSGWLMPSLEFDSNYTQNQDNLAFAEYTLQGNLPNDDPNKVWLPLFYWADSPEVDAANGDARAFFESNNLDDSSDYPYINYIGAYPELVDFSTQIEGRINDDQTGSKKRESFDLPMATDQSAVQIRFFQGGGGSWYWGIDNFALMGYFNVGMTPTPIEEPEATPTPTVTPTNTPVGEPEATPTPDEGGGDLLPPEMMPELTAFDCNSAEQITAVPGGFNSYPEGISEIGALPDADGLLTDGTGLVVTCKPGSVQLVMLPTVEVGERIVLISATVRTTAAGASVGLAGIDASMDGSIATNIPANSDIYMGEYKRILLGFSPKGTSITPAFQLANLAGETTVTAYLDNVEIFTAPAAILDLMKYLLLQQDSE